MSVGLRRLAGTCIGDVAFNPGRDGMCNPCGEGRSGGTRKGLAPPGKAATGDGSVGVMAITWTG